MPSGPLCGVHAGLPGGHVTGYFTTERHDQLRRRVREFAETKVRPLIPEMEASKSVQHTLSRLIARQGWIGITIGHQYGGMGLGHLAKTIIIEELSRSAAPWAPWCRPRSW